jgi:hypothetical protein
LNNKQTAAENVQIKGRVGLNDFKNVLPGQNFSSDWSFVAEAKCMDRIFVGHTH